MNLSNVFLQTLKNALLPYKLGGAAGGSDFDPRGKSDNEVMLRSISSMYMEILKDLLIWRELTVNYWKCFMHFMWQIMQFCQSFMNEIYRYLGPDKVESIRTIFVNLPNKWVSHFSVHSAFRTSPQRRWAWVLGKWDISLDNIDDLRAIFRYLMFRSFNECQDPRLHDPIIFLQMCTSCSALWACLASCFHFCRTIYACITFGIWLRAVLHDYRVGLTIKPIKVCVRKWQVRKSNGVFDWFNSI